jgi:hypothetical protein
MALWSFVQELSLSVREKQVHRQVVGESSEQGIFPEEPIQSVDCRKTAGAIATDTARVNRERIHAPRCSDNCFAVACLRVCARWVADWAAPCLSKLVGVVQGGGCTGS